MFFSNTFVSFAEEILTKMIMSTANNQHYNQIITKGDLIEFKNILLVEMKEILRTAQKSSAKEWMKSNEVRELLNISQGTLQNLRISGTLTYTKFGKSYYYKYEDILKILNQ